MRKMKSGFTLAEVLISLAVIGIISAITLPTTLSNYQAKTVGVKLTKFASQLESSAISYVSDYGSFKSADDASKFLKKSFIFKNIVSPSSETGKDSSASLLLSKTNLSEVPTSIALLRDGTGLSLLDGSKLEAKDYTGVLDRYKVGEPKFIIKFFSNVKGLPSFAQQNFNFIVTELGYVYPHSEDTCLWELYNNDYATNSDTYSEGSVCTKGGVAEGGGGGGSSLLNSGESVDLRNLDKTIEENLEKYFKIFNQ